MYRTSYKNPSFGEMNDESNNVTGTSSTLSKKLTSSDHMTHKNAITNYLHVVTNDKIKKKSWRRKRKRKDQIWNP